MSESSQNSLHVTQVTDDGDSEDSWSNSATDEDSSETLLQFSDRIAGELRSSFRRNEGFEGFCEDVYEDKFSAHRQSGSHCYYSDILAQLDRHGPAKNERCVGAASKNRYRCQWKCSGKQNALVGVGPLEELFRVLDNPAPAVALNAIAPLTWSENTPAVADNENQNIHTQDDMEANVSFVAESSTKCREEAGVSTSQTDHAHDVNEAAVIDDSTFLDTLNRWGDHSLSTSEQATTAAASAMSDFRFFYDYQL